MGNECESQRIAGHADVRSATVPFNGFGGNRPVLSHRPQADADEALMFRFSPISEIELPEDGGEVPDAPAIRLVAVSPTPPADVQPVSVPLRSERARALLLSVLGAPDRAAS